MSRHVLNPIYSTHSHLQTVVNSYLYGVHQSLGKVTTPSPSMASYAALAADEAQPLLALADRYYRLAVLNTSLHQLARCLRKAWSELSFFEGEHADLAYYATCRHQEATPRSLRARKTPRRRPVSPAALAPFQLRAMLAPYFAGGPSPGEKIGTSQAGDFTYYSQFLREGQVYRLLDPHLPATSANIILLTRAELRAMGCPDKQPGRRWAGCGVSLDGSAAAAALDQLLVQGQQAAALYRSLAPTDADGFCQLYQLLQAIMDGNKSL